MKNRSSTKGEEYVKAPHEGPPPIVERSTKEWKDLINIAIHKLRNGDAAPANKVCDDLHAFEAAGGELPESVDYAWEKLSAIMEKR